MFILFRIDLKLLFCFVVVVWFLGKLVVFIWLFCMRFNFSCFNWLVWLFWVRSSWLLNVCCFNWFWNWWVVVWILFCDDIFVFCICLVFNGKFNLVFVCVVWRFDFSCFCWWVVFLVIFENCLSMGVFVGWRLRDGVNFLWIVFKLFCLNLLMFDWFVLIVLFVVFVISVFCLFDVVFFFVMFFSLVL